MELVVLLKSSYVSLSFVTCYLCLLFATRYILNDPQQQHLPVESDLTNIVKELSRTGTVKLYALPQTAAWRPSLQTSLLFTTCTFKCIH